MLASHMSKGRRLNRLACESSPYLLQHADNPVDWYPWCEEALRKAKEEDKPIFLSIGYSACHWCHVMEHESFEDEDVARIMNEHFINIKVDREERPDIDDVYQKVCQLVTGTGGWPLSVFLTSDLKPFYVGTYFPKEDRYGIPSFPRLLKYLADLYRNDRAKIERQTEMIMAGLSMIDRGLHKQVEVIDKGVLDEAAIHLLDEADTVNGGFGSMPKFPNATSLMFMLRYYRLSRISRFLNFVLFTLDKMYSGGIYDHIGGGFHRYATDSRWLVPHFEKMLYDNALLAILYSEAYQISKDARYLEIARSTLEYMLREMSVDGLFASSQDADSEGEEGKYYTWSKKEVYELLGDRADVLCLYYGISEQGNFEGRNILHIEMSLEKVSSLTGKSIETIKAMIDECKSILFNARDIRVKPARDDKAILSWNSLAISAMIKGYRVSNHTKYLDAATDACKVIESRMRVDSRLYRIYKDGNAKIPAYLDDYAFYINALLDIFSVDTRAYYLDRAVEYAGYILEHFWDNDAKDLYYTSDEHERLIIRDKSVYDLSIPSGNSMTALAFLRLYAYTQDRDYIDKAEHILKRYALSAAENPSAFSNMLNALYLYIARPLEVTVIGNNESTRELLWRSYLPELVDANVTDNIDEDLSKRPFFNGKHKVHGKQFTVYVCKDFRCSLPLHDIEEVARHVMEEIRV